VFGAAIRPGDLYEVGIIYSGTRIPVRWSSFRAKEDDLTRQLIWSEDDLIRQLNGSSGGLLEVVPDDRVVSETSI
jgi:hypothetical protein